MMTELSGTIEQPRAIAAPAKPISPMVVFKATVLKDLRIEMRYLPNFIGRFVELAIRVGFFFLLAQVMSIQAGDQTLSGNDLLVFMYGGLLLFVYSNTALWSPLNSVLSDLRNGTLEFLYSNPSSRYAYFVGNVVSNALINQIVFLPLFLLLVLTSNAGFSNMMMILLVCLAILTILMALGIMVALLALLWRQVSAFVQILTILLEFLSGAYFPVSTYPGVLRYLAYLLPYTWGYDLIRYYSLGGQWETILPIWYEWLILAGFAVVLIALSRLLLRRAERRSKKNGLHHI